LNRAYWYSLNSLKACQARIDIIVKDRVTWRDALCLLRILYSQTRNKHFQGPAVSTCRRDFLQCSPETKIRKPYLRPHLSILTFKLMSRQASCQTELTAHLWTCRAYGPRLPSASDQPTMFADRCLPENMWILINLQWYMDVWLYCVEVQTPWNRSLMFFAVLVLQKNAAKTRNQISGQCTRKFRMSMTRIS
jgi:hypothetical protein